ncbi:MAG: 23S rRNA (pseudouridine(1915)-N(3))-methyltransferase RlmH [Hyphomicrobiaceae bacterium]|nr:23S rRNA (pseudouridine(1915)-N(3))-methyltransferase RlmH [Hyphomicrobiaceae bacterium]
MRLSVVAVGRLKDGAERALLDRYVGLASGLGRSHGLGPFDVVEVPEGKAAGLDARRTDEAQRLIRAAGEADQIILLDETGRSVTSAAFAADLRHARDSGVKRLAFLIGGADGHGSAARDAARRAMSLGAITLPHGLARIVLAEQVYRAISIIAGHPYHRA